MKKKLGCGITGGFVNEILPIKIIEFGFTLQFFKSASRILVFLTTYCCKDILSRVKIKKNSDGAYDCKYLSPIKRGNYILYFEVKKIIAKIDKL